MWRAVEYVVAACLDPFERDPSAVLTDVLQERVTPHAAREVYGVVLRGEGSSLEVDEAATYAVRAGASSEG